MESDATPTPPTSVDTPDKYDEGDHVKVPAPDGGTTHAVVADQDGFKDGAIPDGRVAVYVVVPGSEGYDDDTFAHFPPERIERV